MKPYQWLIVSFIGLFVSTLCFVLGLAVSYTYMIPQTYPETIVLTREVVVEHQIPFEIVTTVEVIKEVEKIVEVTPLPPVVEVAPVTPVVTELVTEPQCTNIAWVVSQPKSDLQGSAMKMGTIKRLRFVLRNEGTCIWENYLLVSAGVFPDLEVPYTEPGETAEIVYDFQAYKNLEARFVLQAPNMSGLFGVMNSASPGIGEESIYYRLDVYKGKTIIQIPAELGGGTIECGPGG